MNREIVNGLVPKAMAGDEAAFALLCENIAKDVIYICTKITGSRQTGEDAAQDVLLYLKSRITRLRSAEAFYTWLNRCIAGTCNRMLRREKQHLPLHESAEAIVEKNPEFLPAEWAEKDELRQQVVDSLHRLPSRQRYILIMFYFEDMSIGEIADSLSLSQNAANQALHRARGALKRQLEKKHGLTSGSNFSLQAGAPLTLSAILQQDMQAAALASSAAKILVPIVATGATAATAGTAVAGIKAGISSTASAITVGAAGVAGAAIITFSTLVPAAASAPTPQPEAPNSPAVAAQWQQDSTGYGNTGAISLVGPEEEALPETPPSGSDSLSSGVSSSSPESDGSPATSSPTDGDRQSASSKPTAPPVQPAVASVTGRLMLLVNGSPAPLRTPQPAYTAQLWQNGTLVTQSEVTTTGSYTLTFTPESADSEYTLRVLRNFGRSCPFTSGQEWEEQTLHLQNAAAAAQDIYLLDEDPPTGFVELYDADGTSTLGSALNPVFARLDVYDATQTTVTWQIAGDDGTPQASGSGKYVVLPASLPASLNGERYTITFSATDAGGNTAGIEREFWLFLA